LINEGEFVWSDTDVVLNGRPALYISRSYRAFDSREGIFGKGWSTHCEKSLIRTVGFVNEDGEPTSEPVVKYIYISPIGKRYEFLESAPDTFITPDGMAGSTLSLTAIGNPQINYIDGSSDSYNSFGQLANEKDRNGNAVTYTYQGGKIARMADSHGRYLEFAYDSSGYVSTVTDHTTRSWSYIYNADGTLASVTDPANGVLSYEYTPVYRAFDAQVYPAITKITDESGVVVVSVVYGANGRVFSYTMGENTYTYTKDDRGFFYKTDSLGSEWSYVTDEFGRKTEVLPPINAGTPIRYEYNDNGNVTKLTNLVGTEFTSTYDDLGRITSSTDPDGTTTLSYQGGTSYLTEALSATDRRVQIEYDNRGNPTTITDPLDNQSTMRWNGQGDLISASDPLDNTASQTYDAIGLITRATDPLLRSTDFEYDPLGNLIISSFGVQIS